MGLEEFGPEVKSPKPLLAARKRLIKKAKPKAVKRRAKRAERLARTAPAREALAAKRAAAPPKDVTIELSMPHWINGIAYGPGRVTVSPGLALVLSENEQRVRQNDADMMGGGRAQFIGPGGKRIPVPYASMDSPNLSMVEAFSL